MTDNRVALVTGGSRGIGRACVLRLASDGYDVAFAYRSNEEAANEVTTLASEHGGTVRAFRAEMADADEVRGMVQRVTDELGAVDVLVTSAGITRDNPLVMMNDEDWHAVLDVNLDGVYHTCRAVIFEMMKRGRGSIVNLSSVAGVHGNATQTNYSAAKAGIIGFSKALAKESGRYGIRVNVVAPGFVDTDMTAGLSEQVRQKSLASVPLRRFGTADEVADLVSFVSSDRAAYVTGSVLHVDGGITL
ncbi:3-oxoacyl-[acyl-carrier-protein] reductase [Saccharomonospora saliphila]|uniref:3-oxoacyl-[acyl-carrier-protein] reductase n=1 Tax=Saccharomonospora saliphila TaxID=369829 RepID=UPI00036AA465|nr:3-oxoacyl-[acyl-carrier-protein] reductase [Saccharomonospora saliphila]